MNDILFLPVKPKWAKLIMSGKKPLELRKRLPTKGFGNRCVIYASSPMCEILGTCTFVDCGRIVTLDNDLLDRACVTRSEYDAYFGQGEGHAIVLSSPHVFMHGVSLATMRERWQLEPPQQWRYIDQATLDAIVSAGR